MGRYRTPATLLALRGNPSKRPLRNEPQPDRGAECPSPPSWLGAYAREEWVRSAPELHRIGLLTILDHAVFAGYCQSYHHWRTCEELLARQAARKREGGLLTVANGRVHPLTTIAKAAAQMLAFAGVMGMTPVARARIGAGIGGQDSAGDGKFDGLLRGA
jgi:P27 family predicted phage terminase small subunit